MDGHSDNSDVELRLALQRLVRDIRRNREAGLSDSQLAVLFHLAKRGDLFPSELAELESIAPPSINRTLNGLESAGLVERRPADDDGRRVRVRLTDAGRAVIEQTRRLRDAWFSRRLEELSPAERASLDAIVPLLRRLAEQ
ncbi:MAG: MarR family transcriptional regulator [Actinomycetales bacterium]|nr:MarR family transcriptional regulator [Actinomycetales bacterium]